MNKSTFPFSFIVTCSTALTIFHMASMSVSLGAEMEARERKDDAHDRVLRKLCLLHEVSSEHFRGPSDKPVPIFDIKKSLEHNTKKIHGQQLTHIQHIAPHLVPATVSNPTIETKYSLGSLLYAPISMAGRILYAPINLGSTLYSYFPSMQSPSKNPASSTQTPTAKPLDESFLLVGNASMVAPSNPSAQISAPEPSIADTTVVNTNTQDSSAKETPKKSLQQIILSLDGGGGKGFTIAKYLSYMETELKAMIADFATVIGGTSIGGILGTGLAIKNQDGRPCMSGADLVNLFVQHFADIFPKHNKYNIPAQIWDEVSSMFYSQYYPQPLETILQKYLGQATLSYRYNPDCDLFVMAVDALTNSPYMMSSSAHPDMLAWEADRSTSAASSFFPAYKPKSLPVKVELVDGGFYANNPAFVTFNYAYERALAQNVAFDPILLSLGTCRDPVNPIPTNAGKITGVSAIVETLIDTQVRGTEMTMEKLMKPGVNYFRLNPTLDQYVPMDEFYDYKDILTKAAESQYDKLDKFMELDAVRLRLEAK